MTRLQSLLLEVRRRTVARAAVVCAATGLVVLQAADILVPALHLPQWTVTFVVVLLALGFPLALALSWVLEVTPAELPRQLGFRRDPHMVHGTQQ